MTEAAGVIGDAQVRGWGTLGGALAEADPAGDWGPVVQALEGRVECTGRRGCGWWTRRRSSWTPTPRYWRTTR